MVKAYLFEAAGVLLTRVRGWCRLNAWGMHLKRRMGLKMAEIVVARKVATALHRLRRDGTGFIWSTKETATERKQPPRIPLPRKRCPGRNGGVGEIDQGFTRPQRALGVFNIGPSEPSNAITQVARPLLRREQ